MYLGEKEMKEENLSAGGGKRTLWDEREAASGRRDILYGDGEKGESKSVQEERERVNVPAEGSVSEGDIVAGEECMRSTGRRNPGRKKSLPRRKKRIKGLFSRGK